MRLFSLTFAPFLVLAAAFALLCLPTPGATAAGALPQPQNKIVYYCSPGGPGTGAEICMINPEGTGFQRLTDDPHADYDPELAPNGRQIAWGHDVIEVWLMDSDGSNKHRVTDLIAAFRSPTWSPDGRRLAFACNNPAHLTERGICLINADGSGFQFKDLGIDIASPEWSPDGQNILFEHETVSINEDLFVLNVNTGVATNITNTGTEYEHGTWSPDSSKIAFIGSPTPADQDTLANLYVMNANGSGRQMLFNPMFGATANSNPTWSPDGDQIAFFCSHSDIGADELCVVNAATGNLDDLVQQTGFSFEAAHRPDWGLVGGVTLGDGDCSGAFGIGDAQKTARKLINLAVTKTEPCPDLGDMVLVAGMQSIWGDVDCNGVLTIGDAQKIARFLVGLPVTQTQPCPELGTLV